MASGRTDRTGQVFGKWTVLRRGERVSGKGQLYWLCRCACGNECEVDAGSLTLGRSNGCIECSWAERRGAYVITWGGRSLTASQWARMLDIRPGSMQWRLTHGWTPREALTRGVDPLLLDILIPDLAEDPHMEIVRNEQAND